MFSEESHSQVIAKWLGPWRKMGAPKPHTYITDRSRALLNATTQVCTRFKYVESYADAFMNDEEPQNQIFIRLDNIHTMNNKL